MSNFYFSIYYRGILTVYNTIVSDNMLLKYTKTTKQVSFVSHLFILHEIRIFVILIDLEDHSHQILGTALNKVDL